MGWKILYDNGMILVILIQYAMHIWLHLLSSNKGKLKRNFSSTTVTDRTFICRAIFPHVTNNCREIYFSMDHFGFEQAS